MSNTNLYHSPETAKVAALFPRWSQVNNNIMSMGQKLLNVHAVSTTELRITLTNIYKQMFIDTANIDEVCETWMIDPIDIYQIDGNMDPSTFLSSVTSIVGKYPDYDITNSGYIMNSGVMSCPISLVTDEDCFYKARPTAYKHSTFYEGDEQERYLNCIYYNGKMRIKLNSDYLEKRIDFPKSQDTFSSIEAFSTSVDADEKYARLTDITPAINAMTNYRPTASIIETNLKVYVDQSTQSVSSPYRFIAEASQSPSGYFLLGSGYSNAAYEIIKPNGLYRTDTYNDIYDFDNDGIVNEAEEAQLLSHLGKTRTDIDMTDDIWFKLYAKYDIDGDDKISGEDLRVLRMYMHTCVDDTTDIVIFKMAGIFRIDYDSCQGGGVTGYVPNGNDAPYVWRNNTFNNSVLTSMKPEYQDVAYDYVNDMFYFTNKYTKAIHAMIFNDNNKVIDSVKIILPLKSFKDEPRGATYSHDGMLTTVMANTISNTAYLCSVDTYQLDVDNSGRTLMVYPQINDRRVYRKNGYLDSMAYGITNYFGDILLLTQGNRVLRLDPIYDVAFYSTEANRIHIREWFQEVWLYDAAGNVAKAKPVWNRVWNEYDEFALKKGLTRLPGERNEDFKRRINDVYVHYPYANEQGYIDGITRDAGLDRFTAYTNTVITLQNVVLDPTDVTNVFKLVLGWYAPLNLAPQEIIKIPVINKYGTTLYYKYNIMGYHPYNGLYGLLYTIDYSTVIFAFRITTEIQDMIRITYSYLDANSTKQIKEEQFIINPTADPAGTTYLEIFRMDDFDRISNPKYGFYDEESNPTQKLYNLIKELRIIDNTTWANMIANQSRFDTAPKYFATKTKTPQYWQE